MWNPYIEKDIKAVESVQSRSARFDCKDNDWHHSVTQMLQQLGWTALEQRRTEPSVGFLYKIVNGKVAVTRKKILGQPCTSTRRNHNKQFITIGAITNNTQK